MATRAARRVRSLDNFATQDTTMNLISDEVTTADLNAAFWLGYEDQLAGEGGRTHPTSQDWNESYDSGMNLADSVVDFCS